MVTEAWQKILDMQKAGQLVTSKIETVNRGGVIITVEGVQGAEPLPPLLVAPGWTPHKRNEPKSGRFILQQVAGPCSTSKNVDVPSAGFIPMSRLDPSRLTDMSVDAAGSEDQAQVSLDEPKRSAMVGQEIKAKIIQASHMAAAACSQHEQPPARLPPRPYDLLCRLLTMAGSREHIARTEQ